MVERFDRLTIDDDVLRLHQEDFCQAVGRLPKDKYEAPHGPSLGDMMRVVRAWSDDPHRDALRLLDFVAINYVAGAPDGHSKNISLLVLPGRVEVAPLYDLATALPYEYRNGLREVAVSIGGRRRLGEVMPRHWMKAAATLGVDDDYALTRVRDMAANFPDAFASVLDDIGTEEAAAVQVRATHSLVQHSSKLIEQIESL